MDPHRHRRIGQVDKGDVPLPVVACSCKKRYRLGCTSHGRGAKKVHGDQIALEALVGTYYGEKDGKGEKAVENLTFFREPSLHR